MTIHRALYHSAGFDLRSRLQNDHAYPVPLNEIQGATANGMADPTLTSRGAGRRSDP